MPGACYAVTCPHQHFSSSQHCVGCSELWDHVLRSHDQCLGRADSVWSAASSLKHCGWIPWLVFGYNVRMHCWTTNLSAWLCKLGIHQGTCHCHARPDRMGANLHLGYSQVRFAHSCPQRLVFEYFFQCLRWSEFWAVSQRWWFLCSCRLL